jgi:hypothetical protein
MSVSTKARYKPLSSLAQLLGLGAFELQGLAEAADMVRAQAGRRIDGHGEDLFRRAARHLLDVHAAFGGGDEGDARGRPVDEAGQIELAGDLGAFLDIDAPTGRPSGPV